jgi:hypothetical protein
VKQQQTATIDPLALLDVPAYKRHAPTIDRNRFEHTRAIDLIAAAGTPIVTIVAGAGCGGHKTGSCKCDLLHKSYLRYYKTCH